MLHFVSNDIVKLYVYLRTTNVIRYCIMFKCLSNHFVKRLFTFYFSDMKYFPIFILVMVIFVWRLLKYLKAILKINPRFYYCRSLKIFYPLSVAIVKYRLFSVVSKLIKLSLWVFISLSSALVYFVAVTTLHIYNLQCV